MTRQERSIASRKELKIWLPGELHYSAEKAPYRSKVERARLPLSDPQSIYGFLGQEWENFRFFAGAGVHHATEPGVKSGQQQLAKFTAGIVDKIAIGHWLEHGHPETAAGLRTVQKAAVRSVDYPTVHAFDRKWHDADYARLLDEAFEETPFGQRYIPNIMECMTLAVENETATVGRVARDELVSTGIEAARMAIRCYGMYAAEHLTAAQLSLPASLPARA